MANRDYWNRVAALLQRADPGQALVEYAIMATLVSIAAVVLINAVGSAIPHLFQGALNAL